MTETKIFGDVNDVMSQTNEELEKKGYLVFVGTNSTLVNMATVLEGIPFVKVKPYLLASSPLRLNSYASDRQVTFYGHFPDIDSSHPATVLVEMEGVGKKQVTLQKSIGNQLTFIMPGEYVKEGRFIEMTVSIPVVKFLVWHTTDETHARLYVEKRNTFTFESQAFKENPDLWATIQSPSEHNEHADSNRTTNAATLTAPELFSSLINDNVKYDMSTASFVSVANRSNASGPPCHCGCAGGSVGAVTFDANQVNYSLSAPSCGFHMCGMFDSCGGGGTNADVWLRPTFKVKVRGVPETSKLGAPHLAQTSRQSVVPSIDLGPDWSVVTIVGTFQEQDERHQSELTLTRNVPIGDAVIWKAKVENNQLIIQTR